MFPGILQSFCSSSPQTVITFADVQRDLSGWVWDRLKRCNHHRDVQHISVRVTQCWLLRTTQRHRYLRLKYRWVPVNPNMDNPVGWSTLIYTARFSLGGFWPGWNYIQILLHQFCGEGTKATLHSHKPAQITFCRPFLEKELARNKLPLCWSIWGFPSCSLQSFLHLFQVKRPSAPSWWVRLESRIPRLDSTRTSWTPRSIPVISQTPEISGLVLNWAKYWWQVEKLFLFISATWNALNSGNGKTSSANLASCILLNTHFKIQKCLTVTIVCWLQRKQHHRSRSSKTTIQVDHTLSEYAWIEIGVLKTTFQSLLSYSSEVLNSKFT